MMIRRIMRCIERDELLKGLSAAGARFFAQLASDALADFQRCLEKPEQPMQFHMAAALSWMCGRWQPSFPIDRQQLDAFFASDLCQEELRRRKDSGDS